MNSQLICQQIKLKNYFAYNFFLSNILDYSLFFIIAVGTVSHLTNSDTTINGANDIKNVMVILMTFLLLR